MGDDAFHNGAFFLAANFGFYVGFNSHDHPQKPKHQPEFDYETEDGYRFYLEMGSVENADEKYLKYKNPYWTDLIAHPDYDSFWKERNLLPHLRNIKPAVLVVGGWFDAEDLSGTLKTYRTIEQNSPGTTNSIVMGPWFHGGWARGDGSKLGDIEFGSNTSDYFRDNIQLPFFLHYLKDAADPKLPEAYMFETGTNRWRQYAHWPPEQAKHQKLFLHSGGQLGFNPDTAGEGFDEYTSDPNKPVPYYDKVVIGMERPYMDADQRFSQRRPDVLTYVSDPLEEDLTFSGPVSPTLHVSTTGTDSDFIVKLIDVYPDDYPKSKSAAADVKMGGYEQLVRGEPFRGKFRHSFDHCFRRGHRLMVQVQSSWFPLVDRNPQTLTAIPTAKPVDFKKAVERVYHSESLPSFLEVEVNP
jgi:putative CocE/NonD family hydrolase